MSIAVETKSGFSNTDAGPRQVGPVIEMAQTVIEEQQAELEQLRERLGYYQAFDSLINDNIKRSAELFRTIYDERERARKQIVDARKEFESTANAEIERRLVLERQRTQTMLVSLMDEAGRMQRQIDG